MRPSARFLTGLSIAALTLSVPRLHAQTPGAASAAPSADATTPTAPAPTAPATSLTAEEAGLPDTINIMDEQLEFKEATVSDTGTFLADYVQPGSQPDSYTLMFSIHFEPHKLPGPVATAERLGYRVTELSRHQPIDKVSLSQSNDGQFALLDFLVASDDYHPEHGSGLLEYDFWCCRAHGKGVLSYQVVRRAYAAPGANAKLRKFIEGIGPTRQPLADRLLDPKLPVPKIADQQ